MEAVAIDKAVKVETTTIELRRALRMICRSISRSNVVPVLDYVLFQLNCGVLTITGSDLNTRVERKIYVQNDFLVGSFLLPFETIYKLLMVLPKGKIEFSSFGDNQGHIVNGHSGNFHFTLKSDFAVADYVATPKGTFGKVCEIEGSVFLEALSLTVGAVSTDALRPAMTGVFFDLEDGVLKLVSTDGHRLTTYETTTETQAEAHSFIINKGMVDAILSVPKLDRHRVQIFKSGWNVKIIVAENIIIGRLIDERYPDWRNSISDGPRINVGLDLVALKKRVAIANVFASTTTHQIRFSFLGKTVEIVSKDIDFGGSSKQVFQLDETENSIEEFTIGFNAKFLTKCFKPFSGSIRAEFWTSNRHAIFYPETKHAKSYKILIMPVMLSENYW